MSSNLFRRLISAALFSLLVAAPGFAQAPATGKRQAIAPGDILRLKIWREPDMSGDYVVDANGKAILPRLGSVDVAAIPPDSLQPVLTEKYRVYLNNPSIEIQLLRRITVSGAVRNPGIYPVDPTMTVLDVVALAGGAAPDGRRDRVEIRRGGKSVVADLHTDAVIADSPIQSGDQLYVPTRAWLSRNPWIVSALVGVAAVIVRATQ